MDSLASFFKRLVFVALIIGLCAFAIIYYPWLFGKTVDGEIIEVERVTMPNAVIGKVDKFQMHSFAVLIQDKTGQMFTSSSEDRRWEVAKKGMCVITLFYRHPPWQLQSAGAFYNARVQKIYRCPGKNYPENKLEDSQKDNIQNDLDNETNSEVLNPPDKAIE